MYSIQEGDKCPTEGFRSFPTKEGTSESPI